jgi:hypothetical protein
MRPLEWRESERPRIGRMLVAERGNAKCFVWHSDAREKWVWEVEIGPMVSFRPAVEAIDFVATEEEAKRGAEDYLQGIIQALLGDGAK